MVGFGARNQQTIEEQYRCKICSLILREPVQLTCAHRLCKLCAESTRQGEIIKCPECHEESNQSEVLLDRGVKNDMKSIIIECLLCEWKDVFKKYEDHLQQKHQNPPCPHCQRKFQSIAELQQHQFTDCDKITEACPLQRYGCSSSVLRVAMPQHYVSLEHQSAIIAFIRGDLFKVVINSTEGGSEMDIDSHSQTTSSSSTDTNTQLKEFDETVDVLDSGTQALDEDAQRLKNELGYIQNQLESLSRGLAALKLSIQEQNPYLDGLRPIQETLSQDLASTKQKIEDLQFVCYDGSYTWKISNFAQKMASAQSEQQTSIYSPPFYSSSTGYKMRVRLYPCGDGNARRTHMSLFFVLMRSEYDAILKFPFHYKVTFCLYNQSDAQRHIIDSFRPDTKSNSFQRPRSEMNIASGIPKFCSLSSIQQEGNGYTRDDTMYIKILIDFNDMPKQTLAFILNLNPGLPTNVQQVLLKQENEKKNPPTTP